MNLIDDNELDLDPSLSTYGLKIFRRYIELENKNINKENSTIDLNSYKWKTEDWIEYKDYI